ncbi:MAG: hypothetical protein ACTSVI_15140 [Promethearchaeota archaeon]
MTNHRSLIDVDLSQGYVVMYHDDVEIGKRKVTLFMRPPKWVVRSYMLNVEYGPGADELAKFQFNILWILNSPGVDNTWVNLYYKGFEIEGDDKSWTDCDYDEFKAY